MKKILGVLGGMGPQASASFYETIIKNTKAEKDQDHIDIILYSHASIPDRTKAIESDDTDTIYSILKSDLLKLKSFGASYMAVPCNTSHYFLDKIKEELDINLVNIVDETVSYIIKNNVRKVGILATDGTIEKKIYESKLLKNDIQVTIPDKENQKIIMDIIYNSIKKGLIFQKEVFFKVVDYLEEQGCEKVILGCTELSYYGEKENLGDFFINPQVILARKCIELCGGKLI